MLLSPIIIPDSNINTQEKIYFIVWPFQLETSSGTKAKLKISSCDSVCAFLGPKGQARLPADLTSPQRERDLTG